MSPSCVNSIINNLYRIYILLYVYSTMCTLQNVYTLPYVSITMYKFLPFVCLTVYMFLPYVSLALYMFLQCIYPIVYMLHLIYPPPYVRFRYIYLHYIYALTFVRFIMYKILYRIYSLKA